MNRHYKTLELDKILKLLADQTSIDDAKEMALSLEPQFELEKVKKLLKQTDDAVVLSGKYGTPSFGGAKNCANALRRAEAGGCLSTGELLQIAETLRIIRSVKEWHSKFASTETTLDGYFSGLVSNKFLEEKITNAIISEDEISDKASSTLADIRRKIRTASSKAREVLDKIIHSTQYLKYLQDAIVTQRDGRYVVPVRSECRGSVPGLVHDTSASGATVFIEPMGVVQANNDIKLLRSKEEDEIERILFELSANAGDFADAIIASYKNLAILNFVFAKANLAYNMRASMPIMNDRGIVDLKQARHPIIDKDKVVPVDIVLGKNFDTLVITGPNTGGKTVMHGGFCRKQFLFPRQCPHIGGKPFQLFSILLEFSAVVCKLCQGALQLGNVGSCELYIDFSIPILDLGFFKPPYGFVREPICIFHICNPHNILGKRGQRLLDLTQILHITVKQIAA